jgi:3'(2'), 5'-bisphosphate nucleotidase
MIQCERSNRGDEHPPPLCSATLEQLEAIARRAGAAILERYQTSASVQFKTDRSPVTEADHAAHGIISDALSRWTPAVPMVSEEGAQPSAAARRTWSRFWLVDPLDGTKEFLERNGEFTVNIALIDRAEPVLGVVFAPALDLLYLAGRGLGAWRRDAGGPLDRIRSCPAPSGTPLVVVESRSHPSAELEAYLATITVRRRIRAGSSLKFCWVADGKADIYPRFGRTMEWDVAAGDCVFRESGINGPRCSPLRYNTPEFANSGFIIGGTAAND